MYTLWKKLPKRTKTRFANFWYDFISRFDTGDEFVFMNHGYAPVDGNPHIVDLPDDLEKHRYPLQHYHRFAAQIPWTDRDAVEVSSGRGGGTSYVFDAFGPRSMTGIDLARASINFCNSEYGGRDCLSFIVGDAQDLPLADACCDILINIESSLNYPDQDRFLAEVDRVLRPGGHFLLADYRSAKGMTKLRARLEALNYDVECIEDVSANIARALVLADPRKQKLLRRHVPAPLRSLVAAFSFTGTAARDEIARFRNGQKHYVCAVLRKPASV